MFSLPKLIVLIAIIAGVWYGFRWFQRLQDKRAREDKVLKDKKAKSDGGGSAKNAIEDMVKCPACGTFVASLSGGTCGQESCPGRK